MRNLTMMTDLYQLTMMYGYYKHGMSQNEAVFDLFFRTTRPHSEYSVMAGTQSVIEYINDLHFSQEDIHIQGHAIECRINAENPWKNFRPSPGTITDLHLPGGQGIRVDTGIYNGYQIPPYYDSMLAKLIVHGRTREEAIAKMKSALGEVVIQGVDTNIDYQFEILSHPDFQSGNFNVGFLSTHEIGGVKVNEI